MDIKDFLRTYRVKAIAFQTEPTEQRRRQWDGKPSKHTAPKQSRHFIMVISVTRQHISNGYTFEQWADDMGADKDSIAAHATFEQCQENTRKLEFLFGQAGLNALASVEW